MAHGTPAQPEEIEPFYTRIRRGRPPEPAQLAELEGRYAAIGGVSPLAERTRAQVDALRVALEAARPERYAVAFGAKHTEPSIEDAAASLAAKGVDRVVGLVLTPHGSSMGSEEYLERAGAALAQASASLRLVPVPPWYAEPGFVRVLAARVADAVRSMGGGAGGDGDGDGDSDSDSDSGGSVHVFFTAHSLPARVRDAGDTYPEQLALSARLVAEAAGLAGASWSVAWQSAGRTPEPWLGPDVRDEVRRLAAGRVIEAVVVCPIGFVADHLEVLYDLDIEVAAVAAECGLRYARTASLNDDAAFIEVLAGAVVTADEAAA
jgi:protoporphyrin/coproporphyrin ferrochelatase